MVLSNYPTFHIGKSSTLKSASVEGAWPGDLYVRSQGNFIYKTIGIDDECMIAIWIQSMWFILTYIGIIKPPGGPVLNWNSITERRLILIPYVVTHGLNPTRRNSYQILFLCKELSQWTTIIWRVNDICYRIDSMGQFAW